MTYKTDSHSINIIRAVTASDKVHAMLSRGDFPFEKLYILPGFADVHVHFREPGFSYKEDLSTGTAAAARGGFTDVCAMPNLSPVPDSLENLSVELNLIKKKAAIGVHPYGALTVGEKGEKLSAMEDIAPYIAAFSDDGKGVQNEELMEKAMQKAARLNKVIAAHCEDESLIKGGYINAGQYAKEHGHAGIAAMSEYLPIQRDIKLAKKTGCKYHVCHVSCKESVDLIRKAKKEGVDVTCETAPHYLILDDSMLKDEGRFKMNPPIRSAVDRQALINGIADGTIDMIATDHAPHSVSEKSGGLKNSLMGIVGLETAFPLMYTALVDTGIITLEKLMKLMCRNPRKRFGLPENDDDQGFSLWELDTPYKINPSEFKSKGKSTPFEGFTVKGRCLLTVRGEKTVYEDINAIENILRR